MQTTMPTAKDERVHLRIDDDIKQEALAVVSLRGLGSLTSLVTNLLKEAINEEKQDRPELLADEIRKLKSRAGGVKRQVAVRSPANVADRSHAKKPQSTSTLARNKARKR